MADVIAKTFSLSWMGYLIIIIGVLIWRVILFADSVPEMVIIWVVPITLLIISLLVIRKLYWIYH